MLREKLERKALNLSHHEGSRTSQPFDHVLRVAQNFIPKLRIAVTVQNAHTRLKYSQSS
jgi:hypothetical protein